jgi:hypothetical protein
MNGHGHRHLDAARAGVVQRAAGEPTGEAAALVALADLGVEEVDVAGFAAVLDEPGDLAADEHLVPARAELSTMDASARSTPSTWALPATRSLRRARS